MPSIESEGLEITTISPEKLDAHPDNPRADEDVSELAASIAQHGQLQPCIIRMAPEKDRGYEVLVGWRRVLACRFLKRDVACVTVDLNDDQALAVLLSDNRVRKDLEPFLESDAVAAFLSRPGWTILSVAQSLGKSAQWVAQRANLRTLIPEIRDLTKNPKLSVKDWPISWLEEIAKLAPETQKELVEDLADEWGEWTHTRLIRLIGDKVHSLNKAAWKLDDATLLPAAGACTTCPKTSLRTPGLFDDNLDEQNVKKAFCRDAVCWKAKGEASRQKKIDQFKAENPSGIFVSDGGMNYYESQAAEKVKAVPSYKVDIVKKSDKGALPALMIGGKNDGRIMYARPHKDGLSKKDQKALAGADPKEPTPAAKLKNSKERIEDRRRAWIVDAVREKIEKIDTPDVEIVRDLIGCFSVEAPMYCYSGTPSLKVRKKFYKEGEDFNAWARSAWERMKRDITASIRRFGPDRLDEEYEAAEWLAGVLVGIDFEALKKQSVEAIPDPKWWGSSEVAKPAKKNGKEVKDDEDKKGR